MKTVFNKKLGAASVAPVASTPAARKLRAACLMKRCEPRYVHCYDDGGQSFDRYTVVFTGRYRHKTGGRGVYIAASAHPFHPQGFGQYCENEGQLDAPRYAHLGKKVAFAALPWDVQQFARQTYLSLWDIRQEDLP